MQGGPRRRRRRQDDPSWRWDAASRGRVVPWPIGLRGCCIIHLPKERKEEEKREDRVKIGKN